MEELLPCSDQAAHVCVLSTCWLSDYHSCAGLAANPSLPELSQTSHPDFLTSSQTRLHHALGHGLLTMIYISTGLERCICVTYVGAGGCCALE